MNVRFRAFLIILIAESHFLLSLSLHATEVKKVSVIQSAHLDGLWSKKEKKENHTRDLREIFGGDLGCIEETTANFYYSAVLPEGYIKH